MAISTSSLPTDMSKMTSTLSRAKLPTPNRRIYFITTPTANSPRQSTKLVRIWQSRWSGEVQLMAISTTTATGTYSLLPPTDPHISSETTVGIVTRGLRYNLSDTQAIATELARRFALPPRRGHRHTQSKVVPATAHRVNSQPSSA